MTLDASLFFFFNQMYRQSSGECRARSDGTYLQADLALRTPQLKSVIACGSVSIKRPVSAYCYERAS